uniref:Cytochrome P450 n=1 Tax=Aegilops tauschii subsp. strangulata TaxID=200361 RepID=A0A453A8J7_AEGTS
SGNDGTREKLTDEQIIDLLIALIYSGYETMSTTSMMAVKYLSDHPQALEELRVCTDILCKSILIPEKIPCVSGVY